MERLREETALQADTLLTAGDVARRLRVSVRQIWKLTSAGRLVPPVRLGRSVRWRESDLTAFIRAGCEVAAVQAEKGTHP